MLRVEHSINTNMAELEGLNQAVRKWVNKV